MTMPEDLETQFGAPDDEANPVGHRATVAADRRGACVPNAEDMLDRWGFFSEFVPQSRGGRWRSTEDLVRRLLPVFRRDPALGLGHGVTSFMAGNLAWVGGDEAARTRVAGRLLDGERIAVALTELDHGNDLIGNEFCAVEDEDGASWRLSGHKEIISNLDRSRSMIVLARTEDSHDLRSLTLMDWRKNAGNEQVDTSIRPETSGMRGVILGAADLSGARVPIDHTIGARGAGADIVLKAFQVSRSTLPALATGTVDASLRVAADFMSTRDLYGQDLWAIPHARQLIARAWGSLLVADSLARTAVRALHLRPDECFLASAATKYLVPRLLNDAMVDLTTLLGSSFYNLDSPSAVIEKWMRDLVVLPIGHAGTVSCLLALIPNLTSWERRTRSTTEFDPELFGLEPLKQEVDFPRLRVGAGKRDSLVAPLCSPAVVQEFRDAFPDHAAELDGWINELELVQTGCRELRPRDLGADASPEVADLAARLTCLMAAGALLGRWYATRSCPNSAFSRSDGALLAAFSRLSQLKESPAAPGRYAWTEHRVDAAVSQLRSTLQDRRSLGVEQLPITWAGPSPSDDKE